jgi:excisionase family DNA binding protein
MEEKRVTVSVEEAGQILGISRGLAYELARQGRLPVIRLGRRFIIPRKGLDDLLAGNWQLPIEKGIGQA